MKCPFIKYIAAAYLLLTGLTPCCAQNTVTIPDAAFLNWLNTRGYSACLNGNQLDTTCPAVLAAINISCNSTPIKDLTGIQYFKNINFLDCSHDSLYNIPALPASLTRFICDYNNLANLPVLTPAIQELTCTNNQLTSLPALPASLQFLSCQENSIPALPALPDSLVGLVCGPNPMTSLPPLPAGLKTLACEMGSLTSLPALPDSLNNLTIDNNKITVLPALPAALTYVNCGGNLLNALPALPAALQSLDCAYNNISVLTALPDSLQLLDCNNNILTSLPVLPPYLQQLNTDSNTSLDNLPALPLTLIYLSCNSNNLANIPVLPPSLQHLYCNHNILTSLPPLPSGLIELLCSYNPLVFLPALPQTLSTLACSYTPITYVPALPAVMNVALDIDNDSNLTCLPQLTTIYYLYFPGSPVTCLPNYGTVYISDPPLSTIPLCGIFNPGDCNVFWDISGRTYYDGNADCILDSMDAPTPGVKVMLDSGGVTTQQVYGGGEGFYSFQTGYGNYTVQVDTSNLPFTLLCPASDLLSDTVSASDSLLYFNDFAFKCRTVGYDLGVQSIWNNNTPRPAAVFTLYTIAGDMSQLYGANCASGVGGQVSITYSGPVTYLGPASGALTPLASGDTLTYNVADFGTAADFGSFNTLFQVDSNAVADTLLCFTVSITPTGGDYNTSNNTNTYCFYTVNALDPNEKEVYPTAVDSGGQWLTYTVRFQNTGTAPAVNIIVKDTLNANLDPSTFQLLSYSAKNLTQVFGNVVVFNFPNINLADSATSDSLSRGFVQYRVKTISNLQQDAVITNSASIYFDLNAPVVTNTVTDTVTVTASPLSIKPVDAIYTISIYPNPANNLLYIKAPGLHAQSIIIYDVDGREVTKQPYALQIDIHNLSPGVYLLEVTANEGVARKRWVKM